MARPPCGAKPAPVVPLGPWPQGIDNVHRADHGVFEAGEDRPARLVTARDVDLDDAGWLRARFAASLLHARAGSEGEWLVGGRRFSQIAGALYEDWDAQATPLVTGLAARVALVAHAGRLYGSDGAIAFEIEGATVRTWGLPVPILTTAFAPGAGVAAGDYLVQATFSDARGNEGGASDIATVTLVAGGGITVDLDPLGEVTGATHVNLYAGQLDQPALSFVAQVPLASLPYTLTDVTLSVGDPPVTALLSGPPVGLVGLCSHRAFLLGWRDTVVFRSEAQEPHLWDPDNILQFEHDVRACESVAGGLWVATAGGLVWVAGEDPESWIPLRKTAAACAAGSLLLEGHKVPLLETSERVALFCTETGLVAGLPGGGVAHLTDGRYHFDPGARVSTVYVERGDLRQILVGVA